MITGLGVVAPNGIGKDAFWQSILEGRSGISHIRLFDAANHPCKIAGQVDDFDINQMVGRTSFSKRKSRQDILASAAALLALNDGGYRQQQPLPEEKMDLFLGVSCPAVELIEEGFIRLQEKGAVRVPVHVATSGQPHHAAESISEALGCIRTSRTFSSACIAGSEAIHHAAEAIRDGTIDIALAGGADAPINSLTYACMAKSGLLTARKVEPQFASCPFDIEHDAGVISEGACILLIESLDHALNRKANIYGELLRECFCQDSVQSTTLDGLETAMEGALSGAGLLPRDVDYINAHGPSHRFLDREEVSVIKRVMGKRAYEIPVSSIKGVTGNPLAAAGPMQIAAALLSMKNGIVPPTANLRNPDPACDLDHVPLKPRKLSINTSAINVHGLGGGNSTILVKRI